MYKILGYGAGSIPRLHGSEMARSEDKGFAEDIANALAKAHNYQWFGYSWEENGVLKFSDPICYGIMTEIKGKVSVTNIGANNTVNIG